jgi:5-methyltetrahydropteroyltriglutamate--homocysteine methyltransferase
LTVRVDDVGSFPLPRWVTRAEFTQAAELFWKAHTSDQSFEQIARNRFLRTKFIEPTVSAFRMKQRAGLDIPNYPQFRDMAEMFQRVLNPDLTIDKKSAIIPELIVLDHSAEIFPEDHDSGTNLRVCITGPLELAYRAFKAAGMTQDVLLRLSESVRAFIHNAVLPENRNVLLLTLDEPSLGLFSLPVADEIITKVIDSTLVDLPSGVIAAIHLHSFSRLEPVLETENIQVIGGEFAGDPTNFSFIDPSIFREKGKSLRAGIAVSALDRLVSDYVERTPGADYHIYDDAGELAKVVESVELIRDRFQTLSKRYGELIRYVGPDCGLGSWIFPEVASLLLHRVVEAVAESADRRDSPLGKP